MSHLPCLRGLGLAAVIAIAGAAGAQYQSSNVKLLKQYTLTDLSASSAASCWGYVSPSGREYALFGCDNKLAFVEITDPANPQYFASIPHTANTWNDIKTYKYAAYLCTEQSGQGLQVIDLRDIDNHKVTLVKTLSSPGRSHTIHVDNDSGFLYCCGTHEGTGTTMCFDLSDPLNPVRVGMNSLTSTYQHETIVHTYKTGPYAGKQVMFSGGEGRGVEIWDVTNKNSVTLIRRIAYPFVGYCHQGWLSADMKYFYVNDEFDEANGFVPTTRTLVFDVSVLETADLVATFSTNKTSIDHNLYWKNDFVFEGNYTSGFHVFDATTNPLSPVYRGFIDTYPANDSPNFAGVWSNYPFFPSGTVIVGDINRGLFILDVSDATKTDFSVDSFNTIRGRGVSGGVAELAKVDGQDLVIAKGLTANPSEAPVNIEFEGTSRWTDVSKLQFNLRHKVDTPGLEQTLELFDWTANAWAQTSTVQAPTVDTTFTVSGANPDRFVEPTTKRIKARLLLRQTGPTLALDWRTSIDWASWTVNP